MGRSTVSIRQGAKSIAERWARASRELGREDRPGGETIAGLAKKHSSDAFFGCDDPLEAAVFSVLVEIVKVQDPGRNRNPESRTEYAAEPLPEAAPDREGRHVDP